MKAAMLKARAAPAPAVKRLEGCSDSAEMPSGATLRASTS